MTKITRPKLTRGTKLKADHVQGVLSDAAAQINASNVTIDQLPNASMGVFRMNFHIPVVDSRFLAIGQNGSGHIDEINSYAIPFTLPPSQEHFSTTGVVGDPPRFKVDKSVPRMILDEFSFSFDQGAAAASRTDYHFTTTTLPAGSNEGCLDFEEADAYSVELSLAEKNQWYFTASGAGDNTATLRHPQNTIFTLPVDGSAFVSKVNRANPLVIPDINHVLRPYTTYVLYLSVPNLTKVGITSELPKSPFSRTPDRSHALYSVQFSLKIKSDMDRRDTYNAGTNSIRNYPTKDSATSNTIRSRAAIGSSISISSPASDSVISADGTGGVNTSLQLIDQALRDKLDGGFNDRSETAATQSLYADSCYEVLTVPLFNNTADQVCGIKAANSNGSYANAALAAGGNYQSIADRRIIPIREPMVVHHIILARSFMRPAKWTTAVPAPGTYPEADLDSLNVYDGMGVELGVGIGSGLRSDFAAYTNLAYVNTGDETKPQLGRIDLLAPTSQTSGNSINYTHDLLHVPLSYLSTGALGKGYYDTGLPIFIGKSWDPTSDRTNAISATGVLASPAAAGMEQFIEVRMRIWNTAGNVQDATKNTLYLGYGGCWLYIIGKKYLTKGFHGNLQGE